jgi:hypothetical protein
MLSCGINVIMGGGGSNVLMSDQCYHVGVECYHVGWNVIMWDEMLPCGIKCYHVGSNVIMWDQCYYVGIKCHHVGSMLSCGMNCYHERSNVIMWGRMLSCGINVTMWGSNVITWDKFNHVGVECYHVGSMLSCGMKCYHVGWTVIMWDQCYHVVVKCYHVGSNVIMFCYHVVLSYDVIMGHDNTPPFYFSWKLHRLAFASEFSLRRGIYVIVEVQKFNVIPYRGTIHSKGYTDFDIFDKMEPPRPEIDLKRDYKTHLKNMFFVYFSSNRIRWKKFKKSSPKKCIVRKLLHIVKKVKYSIFMSLFRLIILALFTNFECKRGRNGSNKRKKLFL